jgi:hypothetical protein
MKTKVTITARTSHSPVKGLIIILATMVLIMTAAGIAGQMVAGNVGVPVAPAYAAEEPPAAAEPSVWETIVGPETDPAGVTYLDAGGMGIADLAGIEAYTGVVTLILWDNQISDLTPLAGLPSLTYLFLGNNQVSDLTPLAGLPNLSELYIWNNQVSDLTPLAGVTGLTRLDIQGNQVSDLTPLADLNGLTWVCLTDNPVGDLSPLGPDCEIYMNGP